MSIKGYPTQDKNAGNQSQHATVEPVRNQQHALSTVAHSTVRQVAVDAVEASSTARILNATAHQALPGDVICFTSGACTGEEVKVYGVSANSITLVEDLSAVPSAADAFEIMRHKFTRVDADGNLQTTAGTIQIKVDGTDTYIAKDTVTPANTVPMPVEIVSSDGVEINVTTGDINIHTSHTEDTIRLGDGTNLQTFNADGSGTTRITDGNYNLEINSDGSITAQPGALTASGSGGALNETPIASTNVTPYGSAMVHITGTFSGSWLPEVSNDGTNWSAVPYYTAGSNIAFPSVSPASGSGLYRVPLGVSFFRVRVSSYTSGTITANAVFISEAQNGAYMNATRIYSAGGAAMTTGSQNISNCFAVAAHLTNSTGVLDYNAGVASAQTLRVVQATDSAVKQGGKAAVTRARNDYTSVNVTTSAYVELVASLSAAVSEIEIFDSSGQTLVLATGAASSEVDQIYVIPGGNGRIPLAIASGARVSIKAVSAVANAGEVAINFYGV